MNKACEYCQFNGSYLSIINPCENCPHNDFMINGKLPIVQPLRETTDHVNIATTTTTTDMKTLQINYGKNTGDVFVTGLSTELPTADEYRKSIGVPYYYQRE